MKILRKVFPLSYRAKGGPGFVRALVLYALAYFADEIVAWALGLISSVSAGILPGMFMRLIGTLIQLVNVLGSIISVYAIIGVVLAILYFLKILD